MRRLSRPSFLMRLLRLGTRWLRTSLLLRLNPLWLHLLLRLNPLLLLGLPLLLHLLRSLLLL